MYPLLKWNVVLIRQYQESYIYNLKKQKMEWYYLVILSMKLLIVRLQIF